MTTQGEGVERCPRPQIGKPAHCGDPACHKVHRDDPAWHTTERARLRVSGEEQHGAQRYLRQTEEARDLHFARTEQLEKALRRHHGEFTWQEGATCPDCGETLPAALSPEAVSDMVALHEIREQRDKGWSDFHPETYCHRCGRRNVKSWFVAADIWRQAFPDDAVQAIDGQAYSTAEKAFNGIVCPPCFTELHERETGDWHTWELRRHSPTPAGDECRHPESWFDRSICPEPCDSMHDRCTDCGEVVDAGGCAWEREQPAGDDEELGRWLPVVRELPPYALTAFEEALVSERAALRSRITSLEAERDEWQSKFESYVAAGPMADEGRAMLVEQHNRIEQLERALQFYADETNHHWQQKEHEDGERYTKASSLVDEDMGARARRALIPDPTTSERGS